MIDGISNVRRLPRLGIIRLGEKAETANGKEYPKKLDHFNLKDAPNVAQVFGNEPKTLDIMLPHEDINVFFPQWRKAYGKSSGLFCRGDGKTADRTRFGVSDGKPYKDGSPNKIPAGGAFDPEGEKFIKESGLQVKVGARYELPCLGENCSFTLKKVCKPLAQMMFLMPSVPGVGVYQISTGSFNSMVDINSYIEIVRGIAGRVSMIPLKLSLVPKDVNVEGKKIGIFHLKLEYTGHMTDLIKYRNEKYLSADLLPQIEHETPVDVVPQQGEALDKALDGRDRIAGPTEGAPTAGTANFSLGEKFLWKSKGKIELRGGDFVGTIAEDVANFAKKSLKEGDAVTVVWGTQDGAKHVMSLEKQPELADTF
jgi:hypothetical protein